MWDVIHISILWLKQRQKMNYFRCKPVITMDGMEHLPIDSEEDVDEADADFFIFFSLPVFLCRLSSLFLSFNAEPAPGFEPSPVNIPAAFVAATPFTLQDSFFSVSLFGCFVTGDITVLKPFNLLLSTSLLCCFALGDIIVFTPFELLFPTSLSDCLSSGDITIVSTLEASFPRTVFCFFVVRGVREFTPFKSLSALDCMPPFSDNIFRVTDFSELTVLDRSQAAGNR